MENAEKYFFAVHKYVAGKQNSESYGLLKSFQVAGFFTFVKLSNGRPSGGNKASILRRKTNLNP